MKWNPKDQVTIFDLMPNSAGNKKKDADEPEEERNDDEPVQKPNN